MARFWGRPFGAWPFGAWPFGRPVQRAGQAPLRWAPRLDIYAQDNPRRRAVVA
jgi:hypothetical protein